jgi:hypothetical protein
MSMHGEQYPPGSECVKTWEADGHALIVLQGGRVGVRNTVGLEQARWGGDDTLGA